jgi:hypothetical protein
MSKQIERAAAKAKTNKCRVKLLGGRTYLVITPQAHRYTVRFHMHDGQRYGVCNCKAGSNNQFCYHLIGAALTDNAIQNMRGH